MKNIFLLFMLTAASLLIAPALAHARPAAVQPELVGYDISWPQCGKKLPKTYYFAIIGVNGGTAATTNPCLAEQLAWANLAKPGSSQDKIQLYVNTANPGEVKSTITTWPTSNTDKTGYVTENPHGTCTGENDLACSWQYGWNRSVEAHLDRFVPAAQKAGINVTASRYIWWLDVETMNTWQSGSPEALARNAATLEGMTDYYQSKGAEVGLYSTAAQWAAIAGTVGSGSNLNGLRNWRPSGSSLENAKNNCSAAPLTPGGYIALTQYVQQNLDKNHSCY